MPTHPDGLRSIASYGQPVSQSTSSDTDPFRPRKFHVPSIPTGAMVYVHTPNTSHTQKEAIQRLKVNTPPHLLEREMTPNIRSQGCNGIQQGITIHDES